MKALRKLQDGVGHVELVEIDSPRPQAGEVLVEVKRAGICGTDLHILHGRFSKVRPPVTMCHEFCGVITEHGEGVRNWNVGDRITSETSASYCGECEYCQAGQTQLCDQRVGFGYATDGAFASYIRVRQELLHKLPDHVSFTEGALSEPLAVATHVVMERSSIQDGDIVLVTGPGTIGIMVAEVAKAMGATVIITGIEKDKERLELAQTVGVEYCVQVDHEDLQATISPLTKGYGVDIAYECTGSLPGIQDCLSAVRKGGEMVQVGLHGRNLELAYDAIALREINLRGSFAHNRESWNKAMNLLEEQRVRLAPLVSGEYPLDQWREAFERFEKGEGLKYLLYPEV